MSIAICLMVICINHPPDLSITFMVELSMLLNTAEGFSSLKLCWIAPSCTNGSVAIGKETHGEETHGCLQPPWANRELLESVYKLGGKGKKQVGKLMLKCSLLFSCKSEELCCLWLSIVLS